MEHTATKTIYACTVCKAKDSEHHKVWSADTQCTNCCNIILLSPAVGMEPLCLYSSPARVNKYTGNMFN